MRIAITGSIATDHLMQFDGRFADSLIAEQLDKVSLSFLVDDLQIRRGGVAANISFGLGSLGVPVLLVGAVGQDFADYRSWLERHGVDCSAVHLCDLLHTARFICTTDRDQAQIASFYPGAMSRAREIELGPLLADAPLDLVLIGANDPQAMLRHTEECRARRIPFAADPSQQLAWSDGDQIKQLIDGATYLFSNEYESGLITQKTGWTPSEVVSRVGVRVTTLGEAGAVIEREGFPAIRVPVVAAEQIADPTGVGDGFRAGFLAGLSWGLGLQRCAEVGALLATHVIETLGPQDYVLGQESFLERLAKAYGDDAVTEVSPHLQIRRP